MKMRAGAGLDVEEDEMQEVPDRVKLVEGAGLVVDVVEEAFHPGVARLGDAAAGLLVEQVDAAVRLARLVGEVVAGAGVLLDDVLRIADRVEELVDEVGGGARVGGREPQLVDLVLALGQRLGADLGGVAERRSAPASRRPRTAAAARRRR